MSETLTLTIEKLAGLGDGLAIDAGRRVFVPYTLPGDNVRARIVRKTKDASYAALEEIITPGQGRIVPVCRHFTTCGGCTLQHVNEETYVEFKEQTAREAVRKAGFDPASVEPMARMPTRSRRRVELKAEQGKLGYYEEGSHRLVDIEECKVLEPALEELVLHLKSQLAQWPGLTNIQINGVDGGYDVVLSGEGSAGWKMTGGKDIVRVSAREGTNWRTLFSSGPVTTKMGDITVEVPPGAFLQASADAQALMTRRVLEATGQVGKVLDLFAGLGTYSFPLAAHHEVTAIEGDAPMVAAMQETAKRHSLPHRFKAERRDLFRAPFPVSVLKEYDAVIINPPRTGAKEQSAQLAQAKVKKLVMISCNPATFTRDARLLKEGGYTLVRALPIDQFTYSAHLEIIAEFTK